MEDGFVKLERNIKNRRWYNNVNVFKLYIHLMLCANWEAGEFMGIHAKRG